MYSLNKFDYEFLQGIWSGVKGAAYNATYEFCKEAGRCDAQGNLTVKGSEAIKKYKEENSS